MDGQLATNASIKTAPTSLLKLKQTQERSLSRNLKQIFFPLFAKLRATTCNYNVKCYRLLSQVTAPQNHRYTVLYVCFSPAQLLLKLRMRNNKWFPAGLDTPVSTEEAVCYRKRLANSVSNSHTGNPLSTLLV